MRRIPAMKYAARLIDLTKHYHLGGDVVVKALRGVSLDIPEGEFLAIMGSSGSGKSTMLNLMGALDRPTSGSYLLAGNDVSQMDDSELSAIRNKLIGFIFQSFNLIPQYTVLENILLPLQYRTSREPIGDMDEAKAMELAQMVGLGDRLDHKPFQLSGGQQQRVAIARALVNDPQIIMADEPTGNLDSATGEEIMRLLNELNEQGRTIIMVTHEPEVAAQTKSQIYMKDGVIAGTGIFPGHAAV
nr:ABC transporter ATP-binding protein [Rubinisphaera sp. JC750]